LKPITTLPLLIAAIAPGCVQASNWPDGDTHISGTSFALIEHDDSGRYLVQIPSSNTQDIQATCGTGRPLWLYGSPKPGKCLAVMPQRDLENRIIELQVTFGSAFASTDYRRIRLLSTRDINQEAPSLRDLSDNELASIVTRFPDSLKAKSNNHIKAMDVGSVDTFFFVPVEKIAEPFDDPADPPCTRWKTMVLRQDAHGLSKVGFLDNMPVGVVGVEAGAPPMMLTEKYCKTTATLWEISPKVQAMASFFNGVGG